VLPEILSPPTPSATDLSGRPMRIQVLLNAFALDGPGNLADALARRWINNKDVQVRVAAFSRGGPLEERFRKLNIPCEIIGARGCLTWGILRRWAERSGRIFPPDILHTHLVRPDLAGPFLLPMLGNPVLVSTNHGVHAWWEKGRLPGYFVKWTMRLRQRRFARIVAVSHAVRRDLIAQGIAPERVCVIANGVDPEQFCPITRAERTEMRQIANIQADDSNMLLAAGLLIPLKGYLVLLDALPAVLQAHPQTFLILVGRGPLSAQIDEKIKTLNLGKHVRRIEGLTSLMPKLMAAADVFVHPSFSESFGLVVAEAQSCGIPVVASDIGGPREIVRDGETGFLVPPGNPDALGRAIIRLLDHRAQAPEMGRAARQRILQLFHIQHTADNYLNLFRDLLSARLSQSPAPPPSPAPSPLPAPPRASAPTPEPDPDTVPRR